MIDIRKYKHLILDATTLKFIAVGAGGFCVNASSLLLLHGILKVALIPAQIFSSELAIIFNFLLHDNWTYRKSKHASFKKRFWEFQASSWVGAAITLAVLELLAGVFGVPYMIGLLFGGGVAMVWNYLWTRFLIWKPAKEELAE